MDDVVPAAPGIATPIGGGGPAGADVPPTALTAEGQAPTPPAATAPPPKRLRTQTGAVSAVAAAAEGRRTSSSGMQGGVGKLHSCIVKVRQGELTENMTEARAQRPGLLLEGISTGVCPMPCRREEYLETSNEA
jgi:hypothetical protein